jgi:hypothetical protein
MKVMQVLRRYVNETLARWRFFEYPLRRHFPRDRAPQLDIEKLQYAGHIGPPKLKAPHPSEIRAINK